MEQGTGTAVAVRPPSDSDIEAIRKAGRGAVAQAKEVQRYRQMVAGTVWGRGFNTEVQRSVGEFCRVLQADPHRHVEVLGNKLYLNSDYWTDKVNADPYFHHYDQRDISQTVEEALRERAKGLRRTADQYKEIGDEEKYRARMSEAIEMESDADQMALDRAESGAPETAVCVIETTIYRFLNSAPLEQIKAGELPAEDYLIPVVECNWAGGRSALIKQRAKAEGRTPQDIAKSMKWDPIGDAEPAKTARTRSLRRCAVKAFSAWMSSYEKQVEKAEAMVDAEFTIVEDDGPQAISTGHGEPERGSSQGARSLPVRGEDTPQDDGSDEGDETESGDDQEGAGEFDRDDAHKALFATLNALGIKGDGRKQWARDNDLPPSTQNWVREHYERAMHILMDPLLEEVSTLAEQQEADLEDLSLRLLKKSQPEYAKDWVAIRDELRRQAEPEQDPAGDMPEDL